MTESPRKRRTAASFLESIKAKYASEHEALTEARAKVDAQLVRLAVLQEILDAEIDMSEKNVEAE